MEIDLIIQSNTCEINKIKIIIIRHSFLHTLSVIDKYNNDGIIMSNNFQYGTYLLYTRIANCFLLCYNNNNKKNNNLYSYSRYTYRITIVHNNKV